MRPKKYATNSENISCYVENLLQIETDLELNLVLEYAKKHGTPPLQITPTDGRHLEIISRALQPKKIVEIGTLCGYSTVCLSRGLVNNGKIYTCEKSPHHARVAQEVFTKININHKVEILEGDALDNLIKINQFGPFDLIFIDADKLNYPKYFDWAFENLRAGGMLIADNVFAFGYIAENNLPNQNLQEIVKALDIFNQKCANNKNLVTTFLPTGEGLMVAIKN